MGKTRKSPAFPKPQLTNTQRKIAISLASAKQVLIFPNQFSGKPEMALHFVGKKRISELHRNFFDDPSPTDCITFPYDDPLFLGEVFVCPEVAAEYVSSHGGDLEEEITLYVVHGFLHLMGYDDIENRDRKRMRLEEQRWMSKLAKNNLRVRIES